MSTSLIDLVMLLLSLTATPHLSVNKVTYRRYEEEEEEEEKGGRKRREGGRGKNKKVKVMCSISLPGDETKKPHPLGLLKL